MHVIYYRLSSVPLPHTRVINFTAIVLSQISYYVNYGYFPYHIVTSSQMLTAEYTDILWSKELQNVPPIAGKLTGKNYP